MNIIDQLVHTTVRIKCQDYAGRHLSGTGFFFNFCEKDGSILSALVTNKHVIKDTQCGEFHVHAADSGGNILYGQHIRIFLENFESLWTPHPEDDVDLAVLPMGPIFESLRWQNKIPFYKAVTRDYLAVEDNLKELSAVEDIIMVGYPNGLSDTQNNMPITRRGITATAPYLDLNGKNEFMIDCACFPGSSGSPVFLYTIGSYMDKAGKILIGALRVKFLGVLWGVHQYAVQGGISVVPIPTNSKIITVSSIPNNLGICIKAEKLLAFDDGSCITGNPGTSKLLAQCSSLVVESY